MSYEFNGTNMTSTALDDLIENARKVYDDIDKNTIFGKEEYCQPCKYEIPIKNKTLEVLERDFIIKYPNVHKAFKDEQDRQLLEFMKIYIENHERKILTHDEDI